MPALGIAFAVTADAGEAAADALRAQPILTGRHVSVQGYGKQNPECARWTDGCVLCVAAEGPGKAQCSTPGIACEPRGLTCKAKRSP